MLSGLALEGRLHLIVAWNSMIGEFLPSIPSEFSARRWNPFARRKIVRSLIKSSNPSMFRYRDHSLATRKRKPFAPQVISVFHSLSAPLLPLEARGAVVR